MAEDSPATFAFKQLGDLTLYIDVYPPTTTTTTDSSDPVPVPAVVFFHGGGMAAGDRTSLLPKWLIRRTNATGLAFISADYRLLPPSTGHDVLQDVVDLFAFLARTPKIGTTLIDTTRLAVAGLSAGGMCAFLAAIHVNPRPRAVLSIYGLGGDVFTPHFLVPKTVPFYQRLKLLDPTKYTEFIYPASAKLSPIAQSPVKYHGPDSPTPGIPANPRMQVARLYLQLGTYLDYWTGEHEPSLSETLRNNPRPADALPSAHRAIFPQLLVTPDWPRVMFIHGSKDTAVPTDGSRVMHALLRAAEVKSVLRIVEGEKHVFDLKGDAVEAKFGRLFDESVEFLRCALVDA